MDFFNVAVSLITLTILEVVLGMDNLVFLAVISQRLPQEQRSRARRWGLTFAWVTRVLLLATAIWLTKLTQPLLTLFNHSFSGRDIFLIAGGLFLLGKSTQEIHNEIDPPKTSMGTAKYANFWMVIAQIGLLDIIFSLDSVLTAVGLTREFWIMATAITIAIIAMIFAAEPLSKFIERHPTIKMLALSFLILIGMVLIVDGFGIYIPRGYIYFALGFSIFVESLNIWKKGKESK